MSEETLIQELKAIREVAAVFDAGDSGHLLVEGVDTPAYLQKMTSNEVLTLPVGSGQYNALLDRKGMVLSLFYMIRTGETRFLLITPPNLTKKTAEILIKMKFIQKVTVRDESEGRGLILLIGPRSEGEVQRFKRDGLLIWKEDIFGPLVWNVSGPRPLIETLLQEVPANLERLSPDAVRLMKMRIGFPEYGVDIDETHNLLELIQPIAYQRNKGCYPGQEVVERILAYGKGKVPRAICPLECEGELNTPLKSIIHSKEGLEAGIITSSLYDPLDQKTIVLACLTHKYVEGAKGLRREGQRFILSDDK